MCFAVLNRITTVFALIFFLILVLLMNLKNKKIFFLGLFISFIIMFSTFGIIFILDNEAFTYNTFGRVQESSKFLLTAYKPQIENSLEIKIKTIKDFSKFYFIDLISILGLSILFIINILKRNRLFLRSNRDRIIYYSYFIITTVFILAISFFPSITNFTMYTFLTPLGAIVSGGAISYLVEYFKKFNKRLTLIAILVIFSLISYFPDDNYIYESSPLNKVSEIGIFIKDNTNEEESILTFFMPLVVESNRKVIPPELVRGYFSYFPNANNEDTKKYKIVNTRMILLSIENKEPAMIILDYEYFHRRIGLDTKPYQEIVKTINKNYRNVKEDSLIGIGKIEIYKRK